MGLKIKQRQGSEEESESTKYDIRMKDNTM